jgi:hypothetical protein
LSRANPWLIEAKSERKPLGAEPNAADQSGFVVTEAEDYSRGDLVKDSAMYGQGIGVI